MKREPHHLNPRKLEIYCVKDCVKLIKMGIFAKNLKIIIK